MDRQFPPEIIQLIVQASLEPFDPFAFIDYARGDRYETLTDFTLLNSTWRGVSELFLYKRVVIQSKASASSFLEIAARRGGVIEGVRELEVACKLDLPTVSGVLRACPHVVALQLDEVAVQAEDLARLHQLRRLEVRRVTVEGSAESATLHLPQLLHLSMRELSIKPSASDFLTPAFLPRLRYLKPDGSRNDAGVYSLLPQLAALDLHTNSYFLSAPHSLLLLELPLPAYLRRPILSKLTTLPPFLYINYEERHILRRMHMRPEVIDSLQWLLTTEKVGLRVLLLRECKPDADIDTRIVGLEKRGIRVVREERELDFSVAIERMEEIVAGEKRETERAEQVERAEMIRKREA